MDRNVGRVIKYYLIIAGGYGLLLIILTLVDGTQSIVSQGWKFFIPSPADAGRFLTSMTRTLNQMTAMIVTASAIAVPITANFYTPKLIELFLRNGINRSFFLLLITATIALEYACYIVHTTGDVTYSAPTIFYISFVLGFASIFGFLPYLYYIFNFLKPDEIVRRIGREIDLNLDGAVKNFNILAKISSESGETRKNLINRIVQLREIVVKSIERSDREIALSALEELQRATIKYQGLKSKFNAQWFMISPTEISGFPDEATEILVQGRMWFEFEVLHHLNLAYTSALTRMWEVVTKIAEIAAVIGRTACVKDDDSVLAISIKFMNTYMRQCVNREDIRAFYNTSYQYRRLGEYIATYSPTRSLEIIKHLHYYGVAAFNKDMTFGWEITFYDMCYIVEHIYCDGIDEKRKFLTTFLTLQTNGAQHTTGTIKAILILLSYYLANDLLEEVETIENQLRTFDPKLVQQAVNELLLVEEKEFQEITDRIVNLDYLTEERRIRLKDFIGRFASTID